MYHDIFDLSTKQPTITYVSPKHKKNSFHYAFYSSEIFSGAAKLRRTPQL
jgi:hypothetical protein